ncbi:hypothetical protein SCG7086_BW_00010, partial [Chlamydiales bacterium SCGC AG-110-P3]
VNEALRVKRSELQGLYETVFDLYEDDAPGVAYQDLLSPINRLRRDIQDIQSEWRNESLLQGDDDYALWQQPEASLEQLIIDYGSDDYVYLIPPEIGDLKVGVSSNLPIPRGAWDEMLTLVLEQNGVGVKTLNPFLRQLVLIRDDLSALEQITADRTTLDLVPPTTRLAFVIRPVATDVQRLYGFLQRFSDNKRSTLHLIGRDIWVVGTAVAVQELLKLYDFAANGHGDKDYRFIALRKIDAEEMSGILNAIFGDGKRKSEGSMRLDSRSSTLNKATSKATKPQATTSRTKELQASGLKVITLTHAAHALFLLGSQQELDKAEEVIKEVEQQMGEAQQRSVYWYTTKHSDAEELAAVVSKVYALMASVKLTESEETGGSSPTVTPDPINRGDLFNRGDSFYADGVTVVNPGTVGPSFVDKTQEPEYRDNFIVDPKTGSIVMVVETILLPDIKELLDRLDVPKKMVQIEVLLFEKRMSGRNRIGLNLLTMGAAATDKNTGSVHWNEGASKTSNTGILEFAISKMEGSWLPAYDLAYNFLISQDDIQINASPTVTTVNQTPAEIAIVEEISVNTGAIEIDTSSSTKLKDSFARQQYGIIIKVTPTIHNCSYAAIDCEEDAYITLETDITFDDVQSSTDNRPNITRRHILNQVRVSDGQTVILGGLRKKTQEDGREAIPFLGDIPGVGKLFSNTELGDRSTEMFIFLTPRIIEDSSQALDRIRTKELSRRPGDSPELVRCQLDAIEAEKRAVFEEGMKMLFGRECDAHDRCYWEYDGASG